MDLHAPKGPDERGQGNALVSRVPHVIRPEGAAPGCPIRTPRAEGRDAAQPTSRSFVHHLPCGGDLSGPFRAGVHGASGSPRRCLGLSHFAALRRAFRPAPKGPRSKVRSQREEMDRHAPKGPDERGQGNALVSRAPHVIRPEGAAPGCPIRTPRAEGRDAAQPTSRSFVHHLPCGGECPAPSGPGSTVCLGPQGVALGYRISPRCGGDGDLPRRGPTWGDGPPRELSPARLQQSVSLLRRLRVASRPIRREEMDRPGGAVTSASANTSAAKSRRSSSPGTSRRIPPGRALRPVPGARIPVLRAGSGRRLPRPTGGR
jgi:hypothetical protein